MDDTPLKEIEKQMLELAAAIKVQSAQIEVENQLLEMNNLLLKDILKKIGK